ncbi:GrpB family protein [Stieleria varia]|nr:GrpB family protein [Stieleria varia]
MSDRIRLMHYDPRWRQEFQQTRSGILHSCLGWVTDVQHIGSTAIEGLVSRPVIDMIAGVSDDENAERAIAESSDLIEGLNFQRSQRVLWSSSVTVLTKPRHAEPTHRVWLTTINSLPWRQCLAIRDHLRSDRDAALRFEETKVDRWRQGAGDPDQYESDKSMFFTHLLDQLGF